MSSIVYRFYGKYDLSKVEKKQASYPVKGNVALNPVNREYPKTKLSQIKNVNMHKPPIMKEILRKLEVSEG